MKSAAIAASIVLAFAGPAVAEGQTNSRAATDAVCSGFGFRAQHVAYASQTANACCDEAMACARYLATTVVPKPKVSRRT